MATFVHVCVYKNPSKFQFPKGFLMEAEKQIQKLTWGKKKKKIRRREILKLSIMGKKTHTTLPTHFKAMIIKAV